MPLSCWDAQGWRTRLPLERAAAARGHHGGPGATWPLQAEELAPPGGQPADWIRPASNAAASLSTRFSEFEMYAGNRPEHVGLSRLFQFVEFVQRLVVAAPALRDGISHGEVAGNSGGRSPDDARAPFGTVRASRDDKEASEAIRAGGVKAMPPGVPNAPST